MLSAGRQVMASLPSRTRSCSSLLKGAGAEPYSPFRIAAVSFEMDLSSPPGKHVHTALVPTIWEVGVTRGIKPQVLRTLRILGKSWSNLALGFLPLGWPSLLVTIATGTRASRMRESTPL